MCPVLSSQLCLLCEGAYAAATYSDAGSRGSTTVTQSASGFHLRSANVDRRTFDLMFSKLGGDVREKQRRKTSVWGYDSGRRRLGVVNSQRSMIDVVGLTRNPPVLPCPTVPAAQSCHRQ